MKFDMAKGHLDELQKADIVSTSKLVPLKQHVVCSFEFECVSVSEGF